MTEIHLPEPMTRFRCNEQGCCCKGWQIPFDADDLVDLVQVLPPEDQKDILKGATIRANVDTNIAQTISLRPAGPDGRCRFLLGDGRCRVHADHGPAILPHLCQAFPSSAYESASGVDLDFDVVCPEVLALLDEGDGPLEITSVPMGADAGLTARASRPVAPPPMAIPGRELSPADLDAVRVTIVAALNERTESAVDVLARIAWAFRRFGEGEPFALRADDPIGPWEQWFETCVVCHDGRYLAHQFATYRRFVFAADLPTGPWRGLGAHFGHRPDWRTVCDPRDPRWEPLIARYLAHRFFGAFDRSRSDDTPSFAYGRVSHVLATALRMTVGVAAWLSRPVDRETLRVCLGAAEYTYRSRALLDVGMPWFEGEAP